MFGYRKRAREVLMEVGEPTSQEAFLAAVAAEPSDRDLVLATRRVLAASCGVPPEVIHSDTKLESLVPAMSGFFIDGHDRSMDFWLRLELELGRSVFLDEPR